MPATWSVNNTQPRASAAVDTNSPASSTDGEQFSTVYEVPRRDRSKESQGYETSSITGLPLNQPRSGHSRDASPGSTIGQSYTEKLAEPGPRRLKHKPPTINLQDRDTWSKDLTPLRNGNYRDSMAAQPFMLASPKKRKNRSFGTIIRRMFGKRSVKNRISMPTPSAYHNDPNTFITSATDLKVPRSASASAPTRKVSRSSALGSHAPFSLQVPTDPIDTAPKVPSRPTRSPPDSPTRPRRASLPSIISTAQEQAAPNYVLAGLGLHEVRDNATDAANIGFAVTSGSNPKRRSRSAGTFYDAGKEHRMSPIQWRQWRRRSDEIRYWRESADGSSPVLGSAARIGSELLQTSPVLSQGGGEARDDLDARDDNETTTNENNGDFNFGLPAGTMDHQEKVGMEERMVTLEIKLMDFEYAISKLQAGLASPGLQPPHHFYTHQHRPSEESDRHAPLSQPSSYHFKRPSDESYAPYSPYGTQPPPAFFPVPPPATPIHQRHPSANRPASVTNTMKAVPRDRTSRSSTTGLTTEHHTTLISLLRREQSARLRLEDKVSALQHQLHLLMSAQASHPNVPSRTYGSRDGPGRGGSSSDEMEQNTDAVRGRLRRRRPSAYLADETDTDDASFHEVYVTPVERGEVERERLAAEEEGVAF